jgi:hypothetical protein
MRQIAKLLVPAVLGALVLAACGSSSSSTSAASAPASSPASSGVSVSLVKTASNSTLMGTVLVNSQGLTLYHLTGRMSDSSWNFDGDPFVRCVTNYTVTVDAASVGELV